MRVDVDPAGQDQAICRIDDAAHRARRLASRQQARNAAVVDEHVRANARRRCDDRAVGDQ